MHTLLVGKGRLIANDEKRRVGLVVVNALTLMDEDSNATVIMVDFRLVFFKLSWVGITFWIFLFRHVM